MRNFIIFVIILLVGCGELTEATPVIDAGIDILDASMSTPADAAPVELDAGSPCGCPESQVCFGSACVVADAQVQVDTGQQDAGEPLPRCHAHDQCPQDYVCRAGDCLSACITLPTGYSIIAVVSATVDARGLPTGEPVNYGTQLCILQTDAVQMNIVTSSRDENGDPIYLASVTAPDDTGRNCGLEGDPNMRIINRYLFQRLTPEALDMELACIRFGDQTGMFWTRGVQNE